MVRVQFMSLTGAFRTLRITDFNTKEEAEAAIGAHAATEGYTGVKPAPADEEYDFQVRYTANPPVGRKGRNIAFMIDLGDEAWPEDQ